MLANYPYVFTPVWNYIIIICILYESYVMYTIFNLLYLLLQRVVYQSIYLNKPPHPPAEYLMICLTLTLLYIVIRLTISMVISTAWN